MTVPRTVQEILDHGDELAARFEAYEPRPDDERDPRALAALREAVVARAAAEGSLREAVADARAEHFSWQAIGSIVGTTGEAARQRYRTRQDA